MTWETRKIMDLPDLPVSCTCVRIPTLRAHAESITIETEKPVDIEAAFAALRAAPGVDLVDDVASNIYPMPLTATSKYDVEVGRLRKNDVFGARARIRARTRAREHAREHARANTRANTRARTHSHTHFCTHAQRARARARAHARPMHPWLDSQTCARARAHTHTCTLAHSHTRTHAHARARAPRPSLLLAYG